MQARNLEDNSYKTCSPLYTKGIEYPSFIPVYNEYLALVDNYSYAAIMSCLLDIGHNGLTINNIIPIYPYCHVTLRSHLRNLTENKYILSYKRRGDCCFQLSPEFTYLNPAADTYLQVCDIKKFQNYQTPAILYHFKLLYNQGVSEINTSFSLINERLQLKLSAEAIRLKLYNLQARGYIQLQVLKGSFSTISLTDKLSESNLIFPSAKSPANTRLSFLEKRDLFNNFTIEQLRALTDILNDLIDEKSKPETQLPITPLSVSTSKKKTIKPVKKVVQVNNNSDNIWSTVMAWLTSLGLRYNDAGQPVPQGSLYKWWYKSKYGHDIDYDTYVVQAHLIAFDFHKNPPKSEKSRKYPNNWLRLRLMNYLYANRIKSKEGKASDESGIVTFVRSTEHYDCLAELPDKSRDGLEPEEDFEQRFFNINSKLKSALNTLPELDKNVIMDYYGFSGVKLIYEELSVKYKISASKAFNIVKFAESHLKTVLQDGIHFDDRGIPHISEPSEPEQEAN